MSRITLGAVRITEKAKRLMNEALDSGFIGQSPLIGEFEAFLAQWFDSKYAICVSSGTMADTIAIALIKNTSPPNKTEVIVPALTFIAHINSIVYNGLTPVFVDVEHNLQINAEKIREAITENTLAIMPAHILGKPADIAAIKKIADQHQLPVVEDTCESLGSSVDGKKLGTWGVMGCFSFFISHTITTGEGGCIITNDPLCEELARSLRNHGRTSPNFLRAFEFPFVGFSAKMNAMEASIGLGVAEEIDDLINARASRFTLYEQLFADADNSKVSIAFSADDNEFLVPHALPIRVASRKIRDALMIHLDENGIECRTTFYSIPTQCPAYEKLEHRLGSFPVAEEIGNTCLFVPCHYDMTGNDCEMISDVIQNFLE